MRRSEAALHLADVPLDACALAEALAALARAFTSETGITVRVQADPKLQLPLRMEAELFRIAQEALTNVRKHARARKVEVGLRRRGLYVTLSIRDDGRGFARPDLGDHRHGIIGMRERAKLLGGRLQVSSREGEGTRVRRACHCRRQDAA